jgi:hypothetical protein
MRSTHAFLNQNPHAHSTSPQKLAKYSCTPSFCNNSNNSNTFYPSPHFTCPNMVAFQVTTFQDCDKQSTNIVIAPQFWHSPTKPLSTKTPNYERGRKRTNMKTQNIEAKKEKVGKRKQVERRKLKNVKI